METTGYEKKKSKPPRAIGKECWQEPNRATSEAGKRYRKKESLQAVDAFDAYCMSKLNMFEGEIAVIVPHPNFERHCQILEGLGLVRSCMKEERFRAEASAYFKACLGL